MLGIKKIIHEIPFDIVAFSTFNFGVMVKLMKEKSTLFFLFLSVLQSMICFAGNEVDSTVNAFRKMPNDTNKVILMTSYANQINYQNPKYGKAIAEEALNISKKLHYDFGIMKANSILAFCFLNFSEFDSARICLTQSIEKAKEINHLEGLGHGYTGLGNVYYFQSLLPSAIESWLKALVINEQRKDTNGMVGILSNIGAVYLDLGNYTESMAYFKKALHLNLACRSLRNRTEIYSNIATIYSRTNRKELALKYHLNALSIAKQVKLI